MRDMKLIKKAVANIAYKTAENNVNSACFAFFYQPKLSSKLMELKKNNVK